MYKQRLLEVKHKPEVNHKWNGSVYIAGRKHNRYTGKEDILNGGNKQCLTLYEQDMNEEAYRNRSSTDLIGSDIRNFGWEARMCGIWHILNMPISHLMISDLLSISPDLHKEAIEHSHTHKVPALSMTLSALALVEDHSSSPPVQIEHAMPLQELRMTMVSILS
jgi:hypothetical protein